jgi:uncharacterized protein YndB with AHSA1/START domain
MPSASRTLVINRTPADVFAFFTDPANDPRWRGQIKDIHAHGDPEVGAVIHQTIAGPMGRGIAADIEITAYEPTSLYAFQDVAGPARPQGEFTFTPSGDGTEVSFSLTADLTGLKKMFMAGPVQKSMDGEMANLDKAKAILEGA